jgi:hypothetical protein
VEFHARQIAPPKYWEEFEDLCLDLFRRVWQDPTAQKNGRRGQSQHGTDVWGRPSDREDRIHGVQCKGKDSSYGSAVSEKELRDELEKAKNFSPPLTHWILATTAPKDAAIENVARQITQEHQNRGLFTVQVLGWEDLQSMIADHDEIIEKHYPDQARSKRQELKLLMSIDQRLAQAGNRTSLVNPGAPQSVVDLEAVERAFGAASRVLLGWPQEIDGHWIERPELEKLRRLAAEPDPSLTVLLGRPGEGKSAILARLGNQLAAEGAVLLAIKADQIPRSIGTLTQLDAWIGSPIPVTEALRQLAAERRVVLLIDQLDALGDLMDQHSQRLSVLLHLIGAVVATRGIRVLLSCREFEFRNDVRLNTLRAEAVTLTRPAWDQVLPLLTARGLDTSRWSGEVRDVLCTPQHLAVFLSYLAVREHVPTFTSYQGLLDRVVRERLANNSDARTVEFAERLAITMAREEELWLARERFHPEFDRELNNLEAADFLVLSENRLKSGVSPSDAV